MEDKKFISEIRILKTFYLLLARSILTFIFLACSLSAHSQSYLDNKDIRDVFVEWLNLPDNKLQDTTRNVHISLLPGASVTGERQLVVSLNTTFFLGSPQTTKMSTANITPYTNFSKQWVLPIRSYVYFKNNIYNMTGDYRFMIYPQYTYGLGSNNSIKPQSLLDYSQIRLHQFVTRRVVKDLRLGVGWQYDRYMGLDEDEVDVPTTDYMEYSDYDYSNFTSSGPAIQLLMDTRDNTVNASRGYYIELDYRWSIDALGASRNWSSIYADGRYYISLPSVKRKIIASKVMYWTKVSGTPHYLDLPSIGWDTYNRTGRGFTKNRFRSNALIYFEGEYRADLSKNGFWGYVVFANLSSVTDIDRYTFKNWHPAIGTGLRVKWNKADESNLCLDFGFSKDDFSLRVGLTENF
ncbi:MAG: BamA/TamA family outer membrane protein [Bacteroidales bacterium]